MALRIAATMSFIVFAVCLLAGLDNSFATAVGRALEAMLATLAAGLVIGWMAQKMIEENVNQKVKAVIDSIEKQAETQTVPSDNKGAKSAGKKDEGKSAKRGR
jgi:ribose/xylose/arabinose/galactoside ABC-type transport system permease subunit